MQRYTKDPYQPEFMCSADDGQWVKYSDASSLLTASEARVQTLEGALIRARRVLENHQRATPADFKLAANDARSALGDVTATKGEAK